MSEEKFEGWVILEQLGHKRLAGYVKEETVAGQGFLRIDIPGETGVQATQYINPSTVYAITPVTEEVAMAVALRNKPQPVRRWELPAPQDTDRYEDEEEPDYEDEDEEEPDF